MATLTELALTHWEDSCSAEQQNTALQALEDGHVVLLPQLSFDMQQEASLLNDISTMSGKTKSISWDAARGVRGQGDAYDAGLLASMLERYAVQTRTLLSNLLPTYASQLQQGNTSFRPAEIAGRSMSWRKDDTRLHVDSFPSSPTHGKRILRVFSNINPHGAPRVWKLGAPFSQVAQHFLPAMPKPSAATAALLRWIKVTKSLRTPYDHYMLQLHDRMKADLAYQAQVEQYTHAFAPGQTWMVYTDLVSHAALRGQHALEQTWLLPVAAMGDPAKSPLAILENQLGRSLV
ncbi:MULTISPECIES: Kdo hydroxylase family protein [unclassified Janthinobacterium]|uniref:Kdo hydroxylase family protein n=1 Tax=unclassified Janthinobacterium TaxID=2610881 RepID=UPI00160E7C18|nr:MULTISPECIES: Kdo hydroxylase family protein [unclassified Janthinobacterium]MBB5609702.1 hypothetical protein [Janthinobacterium sp. S3T4]MBB5614874.1 hypothetical protein [Janthinobacterium sp. S3M3]